MTHTPGPWKVGPTITGRNPSILILADEVVCQATAPQLNDWDWKITEANARLIAAAPDLLEALKKIGKTIPTVCNTKDDVLCDIIDIWNKYAVPALIKAEGK